MGENVKTQKHHSAISRGFIWCVKNIGGLSLAAALVWFSGDVSYRTAQVVHAHMVMIDREIKKIDKRLTDATELNMQLAKAQILPLSRDAGGQK